MHWPINLLRLILFLFAMVSINLSFSESIRMQMTSFFSGLGINFSIKIKPLYTRFCGKTRKWLSLKIKLFSIFFDKIFTILYYKIILHIDFLTIFIIDIKKLIRGWYYKRIQNCFEWWGFRILWEFVAVFEKTGRRSFKRKFVQEHRLVEDGVIAAKVTFDCKRAADWWIQFLQAIFMFYLIFFLKTKLIF